MKTFRLSVNFFEKPFFTTLIRRNLDANFTLQFDFMG